MDTNIYKGCLKTILSKYSTFIFDCDGVFFKGKERIAHSFEFINELTKLHKKVLFLTNNSLLRRQDLADKLMEVGGFKADIENIFTASYIAA